MFESEYNPNFNNDIEISDNSKELCYDSCLNDFLFYFRENNEYMIKLITNLTKEKRKTIIPFLCHFFMKIFLWNHQNKKKYFI